MVKPEHVKPSSHASVLSTRAWTAASVQSFAHRSTPPASSKPEPMHPPASVQTRVENL